MACDPLTDGTPLFACCEEPRICDIVTAECQATIPYFAVLQNVGGNVVCGNKYAKLEVTQYNTSTSEVYAVSTRETMLPSGRLVSTDTGTFAPQTAPRRILVAHPIVGDEELFIVSEATSGGVAGGLGWLYQFSRRLDPVENFINVSVGLLVQSINWASIVPSGESNFSVTWQGDLVSQSGNRAGPIWTLNCGGPSGPNPFFPNHAGYRLEQVANSFFLPTGVINPMVNDGSDYWSFSTLLCRATIWISKFYFPAPYAQFFAESGTSQVNSSCSVVPFQCPSVWACSGKPATPTGGIVVGPQGTENHNMIFSCIEGTGVPTSC